MSNAKHDLEQKPKGTKPRPIDPLSLNPRPGQFVSQVRADSPDFQATRAAMLDLSATLHTRLTQATAQGKPAAIALHLSRNQLLARDRIDLLLDHGSPFLELMPLAGWGQDDMTLGGSVVVGIGLVEGIPCLISASVPTMAGGANNEVTVLKSLRAQEIALANRLPLINLVQSAGANLTQQSKVFHRGGASFKNLAQLSKAGIPSVAVVFGNATAGGAYVPGMSDYSIFVKGNAKVFLGGPPLVYAATGERTSDEDLGGAEMHASVSGVADALAVDEQSAIAMAREFMRHVSYSWSPTSSLPVHVRAALPAAVPPSPPLYPIDEVLGVVSPNARIPFDMREVIVRVVDGSDFAEFKPLYGPNLVAGWAKIHGVPCGVLGNNNCIFPAEARKAAQFIQLCNFKGTPLVFFHNITGFFVGKQVEQDGIIKAGSLFINAVANRQVPAISILVGASYGAGNYAMCGRAYDPNFMFSWPNSKCSVMGPEQLVTVMDIVARQSGKPINEEKLAMQKSMLGAMVEDESDCYFTSSRMLDDGIIDPRDTRTVLGMTLNLVNPLVRKDRDLVGVSRL
ncbi:acetyl/propionyl CoA carboxylase [Catenaria anguillulae PL171]|uniref:methylcrotonoyl-CoA carboxylase n=1 Tax=Catenaria anguillulae PL171 TaxID=765915 RepID=A0A1Y2I4K7_9FUNG|nr:acetyl/propionyl CoA carboxylase [Catenaria anguillulae PL171]